MRGETVKLCEEKKKLEIGKQQRGCENDSEFMRDTDRVDDSWRDVLKWYSRSNCEEGNPAATPEVM